MKKLLRRDPEKKDEEPDGKDEPWLAKLMELVLTADEKEEGGTKQRLERIDPELWRSHPKRSAGSFKNIDRAEQEDENNHRQHMGEESLAVIDCGVSATDHRREDKRRNRSAKRDIVRLPWSSRACSRAI
jgi:hypothetical protein